VNLRSYSRGLGWLAWLAILSGCKASAAPHPQPSASVSKYEPIVIRFSDPGNGGTSVFAYARREGIFERELAKVNAKIEWVPGAQAFSANFDAMNAGAVAQPEVQDLQYRGSGCHEPSRHHRAGHQHH
jgi:hypothetical protein